MVKTEHKITLEESKALQLDHYKRCKAMSDSGIRANPVGKEVESYSRLSNAIPFNRGSVLDIGCGYGGAIRYLNRFSYHGVEILDGIAETMKNRGYDVKQGYAEQLPYKDNHFDVVWARHVLEHSTDIDLVLSEIKRVLKPTGVLAFAVPSDYNTEPAHIYRYDKKEWERAFIRNNFELYKEWVHDFNLHEFCGILLVDKYS